MIWNDCRPSSSAAAGRDREYPSLIADALRDAANPSGEFDCARLREMLVGKYGEAKGGPIFQSLLANSGILELPPPWALTSSRTLPAWRVCGATKLDSST